MADFFTRLAERTLGLTPTVQPVLPSLFAPGAPLLDAAPEPPADDREPQSPTPSRRDPSVKRSATPEPTRPEQTAAPRSRSSQREDRRAPAVERATPPRSKTAADPDPKIGEPRAQHARQVQPNTTSPRRALMRPEPAAPVARPIQDQMLKPVVSIRQKIQPEPAARAEPTVPQSPAPEQQVDPAATSQLPPPPALAAERPALPRDQPATPVAPARPELVAGEPILPRIAATPRSPETPAAPAAPQIHVSIGRIEVRAVTPPPAPQPQPKPPAAPRMSLDDYLRSQKEGRR